MTEPRFSFFQRISLFEIITPFALILLLLVACGGESPAPTVSPAGGTPAATRQSRATLTPETRRVTAVSSTPVASSAAAPKIVLFLSAIDSPRQELFEQLFIENTKGITGTVRVETADNDAATQRAQVEAALDQGTPLLVIQPVDADLAGMYVDAAHKADARVIAFDRLINTRDLDAYVSHDLAQMGRVQAQAALDWLTVRKVKKPWNFILLEGAAGDPIALQITRGYREILDPLIQKKQATVFANRAVPDEAAARAATTEELARGKNNVQAVLANNSALARGALAAVDEAKLTGKVFIAGAGADPQNYAALCSGAQNLDLTLDDTALARSVAQLAVTLADGRAPADAHFPNHTIRIDDRDVFQVAIPVRTVTSDTIQAALVQTGIVSSSRLGACFSPLVAGASAPVVTARGSLTVWMQEDATSPEYAYLANLAGAFMAANPGVQIHLLPKDAQTVRDTFADASDGVDLLWTTNEEIQLFAASDLLRAMDFITPSLYAEPAIAGGTRDGFLYGAPVSTGNNLVLYYNKKLLREPPKDTDALIRLGATLTKEPLGQYALVYDTTNPFWLMPWLAAYKGGVVDADGQTPTLDTRAMTETLTLLKTLKDKKVVSPDADHIIADAIFSEGRAAMIINGDEALPAYAAKFGADLGVTRLPQVSKNELPRPFTGGGYFAMPAGVSGAKLEIAEAFIRFVTSKPIQLDMAKKFRRLPALKSALSDAALTGDPILKGLSDQMALGIAPPDSVILTCIWEAIHPNELGVLNANTPPDQAARAMQSSAQACIEKLP